VQSYIEQKVVQWYMSISGPVHTQYRIGTNSRPGLQAPEPGSNSYPWPTREGARAAIDATYCSQSIGFLDCGHRNHNPETAEKPPSTVIACPVMYEDMEDARKSATHAISSGCPFLRSGH
jgi:hypothetical protein